MFIDILPELPPDDGTAKVSFYVEDLSNLENIIHQVNAGLDEIAEFVNVGERTHQAFQRLRTRTGSTTGNSISNRLP